MPSHRRLTAAALCALTSLGALTALGVAGSASAQTRAGGGPTARTQPPVRTQLQRGADVSWPNCPKGEGIPSRISPGEPMPRTDRLDFVIVGLTNGPGFYKNPCFGREVRWVKRHHVQLGLYAMTTYPTRSQRQLHATDGPFTNQPHAALRNAGYAEAEFNLARIARRHLGSPMVWVDVEPYPAAPWTSHLARNRAVVAGAIRAYQDAGKQVGIYTYFNGWHQVVGSWRLPDLPTWSTVGHLNSPLKARRTCTAAGAPSLAPSGGPTLVAQWYDTHRDYDLLCPAGVTSAGALFTNN